MVPVNAGLFSSATDEWETPQDLFDELDREFSFNLDVCATHNNAKCIWFFTRQDDGLKQDWTGTWTGACWMNPPYGRKIINWVKKAYEESLQGSTVVCLLPARTDTKWFHDYCKKGEIRFLKGRLYFMHNGKKTDRAPFPSMVVIFRPPGVQA